MLFVCSSMKVSCLERELRREKDERERAEERER
jgi:hypothetical protein